MRDGEAAQYESDAISGVLNFAIKNAREGDSVILGTGGYLTRNAGDVATCREHSCDADGGRADVHSFAGLPLGRSGFANLSLKYGGAERTNRAVQRADAALETAGNTAVRNPCQVWGLPRVDDDLKAFANFGGPAGTITPYAHAGYSRRTVTSGSYYRHPHTWPGVFAPPRFPDRGRDDAARPAGRRPAPRPKRRFAVGRLSRGDPHCITPRR